MSEVLRSEVAASRVVIVFMSGQTDLTQDTDVLAARNVLDTLRIIAGKWKILPQPTASLHAVHSTFCFNFVSNSFISPREKERAIA